MKKLAPLDLKALTDVRDQMLVHIDEILACEKKNQIFLASESIKPILWFLFKLIKDTKPQVGFVDQVVERLLRCPLLYVGQLIYLAPFASKPMKEKIVSFLVNNGFVNHVEPVLALIGRVITEEEVQTIGISNFGSDGLFQKSLKLADKYHPHIRRMLVEQKKSWERDYCIL